MANKREIIVKKRNNIADKREILEDERKIIERSLKNHHRQDRRNHHQPHRLLTSVSVGVNLGGFEGEDVGDVERVTRVAADEERMTTGAVQGGFTRLISSAACLVERGYRWGVGAFVL